MIRSIGRVGLSPSRMVFRNAYRQHFKRLQSTVKAAGKEEPKKPTGIKALVKEYGVSALGVYLGLSAIDLPIFYLLIHSMGKDEIEYYENEVKQYFGYGMSDEELKKKQEIDRIQAEHDNQGVDTPKDLSAISYILSQFSWAEFAIAYTIHKSFIVVRLPLTATITPSIVKLLRRWGFKIGTQSLSASATIAKDHIKDITASSHKFGTRPDKRKKWFSWFF